MTGGARLRAVLAALAFALGLAGWLDGAWRSPLLDAGARARRERLSVLAAGHAVDLQREAALAEQYWRRYPDVGNDAFYGRKGPLGVLGAREHFNRWGRNEGRVWGR